MFKKDKQRVWVEINSIAISKINLVEISGTRKVTQRLSHISLNE